ncbi:MAG: hypothetical protein JF632_03860, partial [Acidobacteria bacterium]|nr:hypothetical protein [Acidobacteriota bacterium]
SNGLLVNGRPADAAPIGKGVEVTLGADGPTLRIEPEESAHPTTDAPEANDDESLESYAQRYFGSDDDDGEESVGGRTLMIRKAFQKVQQQQRRRHRLIIATVALMAIGAGGYALYVHRALGRQMQQAQDLFYQMKAQDVVVADLEQKLSQSGSAPPPQIAAYMAERRRMEQDYNRYVADLFDRKLNQKERLVLQVTRLFGECDAAAPPEYIGEVMHYVAKWQQTGRYASALKRAQDHGYIPRIASAFIEQNLPPQYFYLAMQESDFDPTRSGPPTRWGLAKRLDWEKATPAAARYIKDIYSTDAQASGLLVMASYNWGEWRVIDYLRKMPQNPRQRNFWKFLAQYREQIPPQTYEYVFSIVSAAVIGENPRLFGFPSDNPLAFAAQR